MVESRLDIATEYAACEAEDLITTGHIQAGIDLVAISRQGQRVHSNLSPELLTTRLVDELNGATLDRRVSDTHELVRTSDGQEWIRHTHCDVLSFERTNQSAHRAFDFDYIDWNGLLQKSCGNLWKFNFLLCTALQRTLHCDRAMIYRFHADWSGEIIAEQLTGDLEPFLGLHYPPTDIPTQARALFMKQPARQVFGVSRPTIALRSFDRGDDGTMTIDRRGSLFDSSLCLSRSVSPYHIEYLRNMGTGGTCACAIRVDGRLWGLVSLHFQKDRPADVREFILLCEIAERASAAIAELTRLEAQSLEERASRMVERLKESLEEHSDPFRALMLSESAPHKMISGDGVCLLVENEICSIGMVPDLAVVAEIAQLVDRRDNPEQPMYLSELPEEISSQDRNRIAGCALFRLSETPRCHFMVFRQELSQVVIWGGDPRRLDLGDPDGRVSPRQSFEKWVESVEGHSAAWTELDRRTLSDVMVALNDWFGVTGRELTLLIRNGLRQCLRKRDFLRERASNSIDNVRTAIALGVEEAAAEHASIIALNQAASEAFSISKVEARTMSVERFEEAFGLSMQGGNRADPISVTVATTNRGIRDCELTANLLFEYIDLTDPSAMFRINIHEFKDVTETRRVEQALIAARDRALRQADLRAEFFAKLSHELRTPLNAIVGISSLLVERADALEPRIRKRLHTLFQASGHMADVIEMSLRNAECIHTLDSPMIEELPLHALVDEVFEILGLQSNRAQVELINRIPTDLMIPTEPRAMRQLLLNLIGNAIKYNVPNGSVVVECAAQNPGFLTLTLTDTGIGMTSDQVEICMRPYTRFGEGQGSGLGLSISSHLVAAMGGYLTLSSKIGEGTTVSLQLPLSVGQQAYQDTKVLAEAGRSDLIGTY